MATYQSAAVSASKPTVTHGIAGNLKVMNVSVTTTAAVTTADTLQLFTLPKNAKVHGYKILCTRMDTNGSPTLTWNVGDAGSATRFYSASTVGRVAAALWTGDGDSTATTSGIGYQPTADTLIVAVPNANPATGAAGTFSLVLYYTLEGGAS